MGVWTGLISLRIGGGECGKETSGSTKRGIFLVLAENRLASQERLYSLKLCVQE